MRCFIVTGTPRSGTSLTSAICEKLGLWMGDYPDNKDEFNPLGYFEDHSIGSLATYFHDHTKDDLTASPAPHDDSHYVDCLRDRMVTHCARGTDWGFKSTFINPHFFEVIQKAAPCPLAAIVTDRPIEASAKSWAKMKQFTEDKSLRQIQMQKVWAEDLATKVPNVLRVHYNQLVDSPEDVIKQIASFLGLSFQPEAVALVNPQWRHY